MKFVHLVTLAVLALPMLSEAATRLRQDARKATSDLVFSNVEQLEEAYGQGSEYALAKIVALKNEILSCGLTYTGTPCLDTQFENFGSDGIKDLDTADKTGYVFFSRFKMKKDNRVLLMSVIANKYDCALDERDPTKCKMDPKTRKPVPAKAFRTGNIWAVELGREKPEIYMKDFLACMASAETCPMRLLLAFDPIGNTDQDLLTQLQALNPAMVNPDFRRLYHLAVKTSALPTKSLLDQSAALLTSRTAMITGSGNAAYRSAFMTLMVTKFITYKTLVTKTALETLKVAAPGSEEATIAALVLNAQGDRTVATFAALKAGMLNTKVSAEVRQRAVSAFANTAVTNADKDFLVSLLGNADNILRKQAYSSVNTMNLSEENLAGVSLLLANPAVNVRGNALRALGRIPGQKAMEKLATMIQDKDIDIADLAAGGLGDKLEELDSISEDSFLFLLQNTVVQAKATDPREIKILRDSILPKRKAALALALTKVISEEISLLARLRVLATNAKALISVRAEAVYFIGQLSTPSATTVLIKLIAEPDVKISAEVLAALSTKVLTDDYVDAIYAISMNKIVSVRRNALSVLGLISGKKAAAAIMMKSKESIDISSYLVRKDAAALLGKNFGSEATDRLIQMMSDANIEVRAAATRAVSSGTRIFSTEQINTVVNLVHILDVSEKASIITVLQATLESFGADLLILELATNSQDPLIKDVAIRTLLADDSAATTDLLIQILPTADLELRSAIEANFNARNLDASLTPVLGTLLNHEDPTLRILIVKQLARQNSLEAQELLKTRLGIETDELVKIEISSAINPIGF